MDERTLGAVVYLTSDFDRTTLVREVRSGRLVRLRRGAYAPALESSDPGARRRIRARQQMTAVHRQLGRQFWFSHTSAALLHGLPLLRVPDRSHLTQITRPSARGDAGVVRHTADLHEGDVAVVDGLPVTSFARTALDCAMTLPELPALCILDGALARDGLRHTLLDRLEDIRGASGSARARRRLEQADGRAESAGETRTRFVLARYGVHVPDLQITVPTHLHKFRIDMGWPELKIGIEFDGKVKYTRLADGDPAEVVFWEKRRQDALERQGWVIIRVTWADLNRPEVFLAEVHRRLSERGQLWMRRPGARSA